MISDNNRTESERHEKNEESRNTKNENNKTPPEGKTVFPLM
jgi:hypothetical protein